MRDDPIPSWMYAALIVRYRVYTVLMAAAEVVNEVSYNLAIRANRTWGWLICRRDGR